MRAAIIGCVLAVGCVRLTSTEEDTLDAVGVQTLVVRADRGDLSYTPGDESLIEVRAVSWGRASGEARAERNLLGTAWMASRTDARVSVQSSSRFSGGGVDLQVRGPAALDIDAQLDVGEALLTDVLGTHRVSAGELRAVRVQGEGTFVSTLGSADLELWPYEDGDVQIDVEGSLTLRLPAFGPYDIEVIASTEASLYVDDIGFDGLEVGPGLVRAWRMPRTAVVRVQVRGGSFTLVESI